VRSESYIALNSTTNTNATLGSTTVSSFASNLPIVMINTFGTPISDTVDNAASASIIDTTSGTAHALDTPNYDGRLGFRIRGSTSENYPKKQYSLELWDESNNDKKVSLLGMPADSDWVLYAPYTEKAMMQNALAYQWANEMGHYASKTRFVEVFLNTSAVTTGGVALPTTSADYLGVYILEEKIKITANRVDWAISRQSQRRRLIAGPQRRGTGSFITGGYGVRMINAIRTFTDHAGCEIPSPTTGTPSGPPSARRFQRSQLAQLLRQLHRCAQLRRLLPHQRDDAEHRFVLAEHVLQQGGGYGGGRLGDAARADQRGAGVGF
jgi:hypothetical protein